MSEVEKDAQDPAIAEQQAETTEVDNKTGTVTEGKASDLKPPPAKKSKSAPIEPMGELRPTDILAGEYRARQ
jgi:hypothetical protein